MESRILEELHVIRAKLDQHSEEFQALKLRISPMETQMANLQSDHFGLVREDVSFIASHIVRVVDDLQG